MWTMRGQHRVGPGGDWGGLGRGRMPGGGFRGKLRRAVFDYKGGFVRLVDGQSEAEKIAMFKEAVKAT